LAINVLTDINRFLPFWINPSGHCFVATKDDANETSQDETNDCSAKPNTQVVTSTTYCCDTEDSGLDATLDCEASLLGDSANKEPQVNNNHNYLVSAKYSINMAEGEKAEVDGEGEHNRDHQVVTMIAASGEHDWPRRRHFLGTNAFVYLSRIVVFSFNTRLFPLFCVFRCSFSFCIAQFVCLSCHTLTYANTYMLYFCLILDIRFANLS